MAWLDRQRKVSFIFSLSVHCLVQSQWPATGDKVSSRHLSSAARTIDGRRRRRRVVFALVSRGSNLCRPDPENYSHFIMFSAGASIINAFQSE